MFSMLAICRHLKNKKISWQLKKGPTGSCATDRFSRPPEPSSSPRGRPAASGSSPRASWPGKCGSPRCLCCTVWRRSSRSRWSRRRAHRWRPAPRSGPCRCGPCSTGCPCVSDPAGEKGRGGRGRREEEGEGVRYGVSECGWAHVCVLNRSRCQQAFFCRAGVPGVCPGRPSPSAPEIHKQNPALAARRQHNTCRTQWKAQMYRPDQHGRHSDGLKTISLLKLEDSNVLPVSPIKELILALNWLANIVVK